MQLFGDRLRSKPGSGHRVWRSRIIGTKSRTRRRANRSSRLFYRDESSRSARWGRRLPVLVLVVATGIYGLVSGGHIDRLYELAMTSLDSAVRGAGFSIEEISVTGLNRVERDAVLQALGAQGKRSILSFDTRAAQSRVQRLAWVKGAKVMRLFPSKLIVDIEEREPFAVWQLRAKHFLIDSEGAIITEIALLPDSPLPLLVGAGAAQAANAFLNLLEAHPALKQQMKAAVRVAERRWTLKLQNGIEIWLPEKKFGTALKDLAKLDHSHRLLSRDIAAVDLRLPDRVTLRMHSQKASKGDQRIGRPASRSNKLGRGV